jgi:flagellar hook protein FlgE
MGLTTFSTGLSGLATNSQGLNVIGNNLANLNTVGYKSSNISFTDVLGQTFGTSGTAKSGNTMHIGLGAQVGAVRQSFGQGSLQTTNNPLDLAIQGKGFLVVKREGVQSYTRAGNLHLDADGNVVTENGSNVQGYSRNAVTGLIDPNMGISSIKMPSGLDNPVVTSQFEIAANLDADAPDGTQFNSSVQVYDSLGKPHMATLTLQKEITGGATPVTRWRFDLTIPRNEVAGIASTNTEKLSLITGDVAAATPSAGALVFDGQGTMTSAYLGADPAGAPPALANITIPNTGVTLPTMAGGGVLSSAITWNLLNSVTAQPNVTAYASPSDITASSQNGAAAGALTNLSVQADGTISAVFGNGKTVNVAQVVLAQFSNVDGLVSQGGGFYAESAASGASFFGVPGEGGRGQITSGALEQSNVDLATELTKIITFQRGYQANARIITVTDQIMQETMNLRQ